MAQQHGSRAELVEGYLDVVTIAFYSLILALIIFISSWISPAEVSTQLPAATGPRTSTIFWHSWLKPSPAFWAISRAIPPAITFKSVLRGRGREREKEKERERERRGQVVVGRYRAKV